MNKKTYPRILADDAPLTAVALNALTGITPTIAHPNAADNKKNAVTNTPRGRVFCRITNNDATDPITVTEESTAVVSEGSSGNLVVTNPAITLAATVSKVIGPWSQNFENLTGKVILSWTLGTVDEADVDIETFKIV